MLELRRSRFEFVVGWGLFAKSRLDEIKKIVPSLCFRAVKRATRNRTGGVGRHERAAHRADRAARPNRLTGSTPVYYWRSHPTLHPSNLHLQTGGSSKGFCQYVCNIRVVGKLALLATCRSSIAFVR